MSFVLDASIALCWCFEDERSRYSDGVLNALKTCSAIVPPLWPLEVANGLLVGERRERLTPFQSAQFLTLLRQLPIQVEGAIDLGRETKLTSYDALYLSLAMQKGCMLATHDKAMRRACQKVGIELYKP